MRFRDVPRVNRKQAAQMLGCTSDAVRKLDARGRLLTGQRDDEGAYTYERAEIEARLRKRGQPGGLRRSLLSRIFRCFEDGRTLGQIVAETGAEPEAVNEFYRQYQNGLVTEDPDVKREREARERREQQERIDRLNAQHRADMREIQDAIDATRPRGPTGPSVAKVTTAGERDVATEQADRAIERLEELRRRLRETGDASAPAARE